MYEELPTQYVKCDIPHIIKQPSKQLPPFKKERKVLAFIVIIASVVELKAIWATVDLILGIIVFINVISLVLLFKYVYQHYFRQVKKGNDNPRWNYDLDITKIDLSDVDEPHHNESIDFDTRNEKIR